MDKDINLFELMPLFRLNRGDGGYYIDKACTVGPDPNYRDNDDVENVGIYRIQVKGPKRLGIQTVPQHDIAIQLAHAEERGEDLPVAIAVGNDPIRATPMRYNQLEYKMAAVMQGKPYRVVKTAKGLDVPWGSEYVLEGRLLAGQREMEGPFGEFPGYYSGGHRYPVIEIDRVSHWENLGEPLNSVVRGPALDWTLFSAGDDDQHTEFRAVEEHVPGGCSGERAV